MPDSRTFVLGKDCKFYLKTAALTGLPTMAEPGWTELDLVKDVEVDRSTEKADVSCRGNSGFKSTAATVKNATIKTSIKLAPGSSLLNALEDAWMNSTEIAAAALTGPKTPAAGQTTRGLAGNWTVTDFSEKQPLNEAVVYDITLEASSYTKNMRING